MGYTFFSNAHETFSRMDHILGHKTSLNTLKSIEIISSIFSDDYGIIREINHRKKNWERRNAWKLNILPKNQWVNNEIKEEIRKYLETKKKKRNYNLTKALRCSKSSSKRGVHSDTSLPQEIRKISSKPLHQSPKRIIQRRKKNPNAEEGGRK